MKWVRTEDELIAAVEERLQEDRLGLDVETHVATRALCLVQIASSSSTYLVDALEVPTLEPLRPLLEAEYPTKLIHNAAFERSVLARHGLEIDGVVDTLALSRQVRGREMFGGHSLKACCARELGVSLDKSQQTSAWQQCPLTSAQVEYAALDAEVLLVLEAKHQGATP